MLYVNNSSMKLGENELQQQQQNKEIRPPKIFVQIYQNYMVLGLYMFKESWNLRYIKKSQFIQPLSENNQTGSLNSQVPK